MAVGGHRSERKIHVTRRLDMGQVRCRKLRTGVGPDFLGLVRQSERTGVELPDLDRRCPDRFKMEQLITSFNLKLNGLAEIRGHCLAYS